MVKLLAVDMDGTCLNRKHRISYENMQALHQAAEAGILVVPTTGRAARCLPQQLRKDPFFPYLISSNGADVADMKNKTSLYGARIPWVQAADLLDTCREAGLGVSVHCDHRFLVEGLALNILGRISYGRDARNKEYVRDLSAFLRKNRRDVEEIQLFFFSEEKRAAAHRLLDGAQPFKMAWDQFYAEVYMPDASKGNALAALARQLEIPREQLACIGDAENDLSMFQVSGRTFAMGNAIDVLKAQAEAVVPDCDASGVAVAIQEYLLK